MAFKRERPARELPYGGHRVHPNLQDVVARWNRQEREVTRSVRHGPRALGDALRFDVRAAGRHECEAQVSTRAIGSGDGAAEVHRGHRTQLQIDRLAVLP
jgi:hypothetical protein